MGKYSDIQRKLLSTVLLENAVYFCIQYIFHNFGQEGSRIDLLLDVPIQDIPVGFVANLRICPSPRRMFCSDHMQNSVRKTLGREGYTNISTFHRKKYKAMEINHGGLEMNRPQMSFHLSTSASVLRRVRKRSHLRIKLTTDLSISPCAPAKTCVSGMRGRGTS